MMDTEICAWVRRLGSSETVLDAAGWFLDRIADIAGKSAIAHIVVDLGEDDANMRITAAVTSWQVHCIGRLRETDPDRFDSFDIYDDCAEIECEDCGKILRFETATAEREIAGACWKEIDGTNLERTYYCPDCWAKHEVIS